MFLDILWLFVSLALLTFGGNILVRGATVIARRMGLSSFFIGLTIVGFGTSTPELTTSLIAALEGGGDIAIGNVVGSNIFNIAIILGVTAVFAPIPVVLRTVRDEVWWVIAAACMPWLAFVQDGSIGRLSGSFMIAALFVYLVMGYRKARREPDPQLARTVASEIAAEQGIAPADSPSLVKGIVFAVLGLLVLVGASQLLVTSATNIARSFGVSELVIGLTIVAAGTSLPELITSIIAALRRQSEIAVGNILGSNVFNILGILGITCVVTPQAVTPQTLALDTPVMIFASVALLPIVMTGSRISRTEGVVLIVGYIAYVIAILSIGHTG